MIGWRQIHWPRPLSMAGSVGLLTRLASDDRRGAVVWEARAEAGRVRYLLGAETADVLEIESLLVPLIPGVVVTDLKRPRSEVARCGRVQIRQRSLALALDGSEQMVTALLAALASATATDDVLVVQVVLGAALAPEIITAATEDPTMPLWRKLFYGPQPASAEVRSRMRGKCDQFRFRAVVRIGASAARFAGAGGLLPATKRWHPGTAGTGSTGCHRQCVGAAVAAAALDARRSVGVRGLAAGRGRTARVARSSPQARPATCLLPPAC